jgi:hypothetical protein
VKKKTNKKKKKLGKNEGHDSIVSILVTKRNSLIIGFFFLINPSDKTKTLMNVSKDI